MPRNRDLLNYPNQQFIALVQRVLATSAPFTVPCTRTQAATMRGELFAWRRCCEADPVRALDIGCPVGDLRQVTFGISDTGLIAQLATSRPTPALIEAALGGTPPLRDEAKEALERLRGIVGNGP